MPNATGSNQSCTQTFLERSRRRRRGLLADVEKAKQWYFNDPLPEFDGQTAEAVVAHGREAEVLQLLEMYDAGSVG